MAPAKPQTATPTARFLCRILENMIPAPSHCDLRLTSWGPLTKKLSHTVCTDVMIVHGPLFFFFFPCAVLLSSFPRAPYFVCDGSWTSPTTCSSGLPISSLALAAQRPCWRFSRGRAAYLPTAE